MLQGDRLHAAGFRGSGMTVAVLDAGFLNVDDNSAFSSLRNNGQIAGTKDFVNPDSDIFNENYHGGVVLSVMAAQQADRFMGTAPDADFWLIRTENYDTEFLIETDNLVAAMEFADSAGVDIINASLGYYKFDDPVADFDHSDLDGKTTRVSQAASLCAGKGMIFLCSAGNQGNKTWQHITVPADANDILAVGSVDELLERSPFSGMGNTVDGRIKPDICALGNQAAVVNQNDEVATADGTSFSTPVIAGMVACLWQALPQLTASQIMEIIRQSASSSHNPNPETGYGAPDFYAAYLAATTIRTEIPFKTEHIRIYPNPADDSLTIKLDNSLLKKGITYTLTDLQNHTLQGGQLQNGEEIIPLSNLPQGIYILLIKSKKKIIFQRKIIKE
jgi:subtilisin family serine protease